MSQYSHNHALQVPFSLRRRTAWLVGLVVVVAIGIAVTTIAVSGRGESSSASSQVTREPGGPDEDLRGAAAAESAGAFRPAPETGGPNETQRGHAARISP
jgi:hypothetical protein